MKTRLSFGVTDVVLQVLIGLAIGTFIVMLVGWVAFSTTSVSPGYPSDIIVILVPIAVALTAQMGRVLIHIAQRLDNLVELELAE